MKIKKGKIIVIEGPDGAGKTTQIELLNKALGKLGKKIKSIKFPQYKKNYFGRYIRECLDGKHGDFANMEPVLASLPYAADRLESKNKLLEWVKNGYVILADRYTPANQIHQGGKIEDTKKRIKFLKFLDWLEFDLFKLPKPDIVIYLSIPFEMSKKSINGRGNPDVVEKDDEYLKNSIMSAEQLCKTNENWVRINCCASNGERIPKEKIHEMIVEKVEKVLKSI